MFIATLIAADRLAEGDISAACDALVEAGVPFGDPDWLEPGSACDLAIDGDPVRARAALEALAGIDVVVQSDAYRRKRLLVADMDSTMITVECIDELADYAGVKAQVADITERAMRGELDFEGALDARVALLKGLDAAVIDRCRTERVTLTPGAKTLVRTMRAAGATCLLVSGGFTAFAEPVAAEIGFNRARANMLLVEGGALTGAVARPIVGAATKRETLLAAQAELGLVTGETLAVGDGANDIPMIEAAGLGIAYHAKPKAQDAADARIVHNDLTALLYAQRYGRSEWVE